MTRFMKFLALAATVSVSAGALAQPAPRLLKTASGVMVPVSAAKVTKMWKDGTGKLHVETGPTIPYHHNETGISRSTTLLFDDLEYDPALIATSITPAENPAYGTSCGIGGGRYIYGDGLELGGNYDDMTMVSGTAGTTAKRCGTGFYTVTGTVFTNLSLIIGTCSNFDPLNAGGLGDGGVNNRGDLDSWIIGYGAFTGTGGWYITDLDTTDFGGAVSWGMPANGTGGYYMIGGDYDSGTNTMTLGGIQNVYWGTKAGNPSSQGPELLNDNNSFGGTLDGLWDANTEWYDFTFGLCPDPLGTLICFFGDAAQPVTLTPQSFNVGLGAVASGNLASLAADDANALKICKAFVPNFTSPRIRLDATYVSPYLTATSVQLDMKARMTTGGSFKVRGFLADTSGAGTFTYGATNQVIADTSIALAFATYSSGAVATGTHIDTDADATTDGTIVARTEIQQTGFSAVAVPCAEWEYMTVTVTP